MIADGHIFSPVHCKPPAMKSVHVLKFGLKKAKTDGRIDQMQFPDRWMNHLEARTVGVPFSPVISFPHWPTPAEHGHQAFIHSQKILMIQQG